MIKLLFADLDGTLIQTRSGATFAKGPWDWVLNPGIIEALKGHNPNRLHIVSNQAGIARKLVKEADWLGKVGRIIEKIHQEVPGIEITYDYCISLNPEDPKRKPNPGMITEVLDHYAVMGDEVKALMIGDASGLPGNFSDSDYQAARNAGIPYLDVNAFIKLYSV